jgi:hypothetical protein
MALDLTLFEDHMMMKSMGGVASLLGAALVAGACSSDNSGFNPQTAKGPDKTCVVGELTVGSSATGDLSAASACPYAQFFDSANTAIAVSYNFGTQQGKGYLISLQSDWENQASLIGATSGVPTTLAYADFDHQRQATLVFVAPSNTGYSVRVGAYDANPADTGAYTLRAQSCKVPLPTITDSITHSDNVGPGDCTVPFSDYYGIDSSYVHLYTIHFDTNMTRTITLVGSDSSLAFNMGGSGLDVYGYFDGNYGGVSLGHSSLHNTTFVFTSNKPGVYTLMVGTTFYSPASQPYTLTVGAQQAAAPSRVPPPLSLRAAAKVLRHQR